MSIKDDYKTIEDLGIINGLELLRYTTNDEVEYMNLTPFKTIHKDTLFIDTDYEINKLPSIPGPHRSRS